MMNFTAWLDERIERVAHTVTLALYEKLRADLSSDIERLADRMGLDDIQALATEIVAQIRRVFPFLVLDPRTLSNLDAAERFEAGDIPPPTEGLPLP